MKDLEIITRDTLFQVLNKILSVKGMNKADIYSLTDYILGFFGFDDFLVDNILTPIDRDIFYYLEECGVLKTESYEVNLLKGRQWRIHLWMFRKDNIKKILMSKETVDVEDPKKLYEKIFSQGEEK